MRSVFAIRAALLAGVFMLSSSAIFGRLSAAPPSVTAFYRLLFATCALLPALLFSRSGVAQLRSASRKQLCAGVLAGVFLAVHYIMWFESIHWTTVSSSTTIAGLQPLFSIILGMIFLAFFSLLGLPFGMGTLILAHTAFCIPYIFMQVKARLSGMDKSCEEAARDLGAGRVRVFFDITLPMIMPGIVSGMLLSFAMSFDDVIISIFVTGVDVNTLPILIYTQLKTGVTPKVNALCTLMFLATLLIVVLSALIGRMGNKKRT